MLFCDDPDRGLPVVLGIDLSFLRPNRDWRGEKAGSIPALWFGLRQLAAMNPVNFTRRRG
jgi:hypothetical protein